jgi:hypothetical protein
MSRPKAAHSASTSKNTTNGHPAGLRATIESVIPEAQLDPDRVQPMPLCDSRWDFPEQIKRLIASKQYTNGVGE